MKIAEFLTGAREFQTKSQIIEAIKTSKNYGGELERHTTKEALMLFETSKQHTWLISTSERLYCILDDIRNDAPHVNWSMSRNEIVEAADLKLSINSREKSEKSGYVDIGTKHSNWLYSKKLFQNADVEDSIRSLIKTTMSSAA